MQMYLEESLKFYLTGVCRIRVLTAMRPLLATVVAFNLHIKVVRITPHTKLKILSCHFRYKLRNWIKSEQNMTQTTIQERNPIMKPHVQVIVWELKNLVINLATHY